MIYMDVHGFPGLKIDTGRRVGRSPQDVYLRAHREVNGHWFMEWNWGWSDESDWATRVSSLASSLSYHWEDPDGLEGFEYEEYLNDAEQEELKNYIHLLLEQGRLA